MKNFIKQLTFDTELVEAMQTAKVNRDILYLQLLNGKITMQEFIAADKRAAK